MPPTDAASEAPLLRMRGIRKSFPGVKALKGVDLSLHAGEVLALLGENGAGKSTLIKILGGAHQPDEGTIEIGEHPASVATPQSSQAAGIVYAGTCQPRALKCSDSWNTVQVSTESLRLTAKTGSCPRGWLSNFIDAISAIESAR